MLSERSMEAAEIRSILKTDQSPKSSDAEVRSILKPGNTESSSSDQAGITHGILKDPSSLETFETHGILKKDKSLEGKSEVLPEKGVLKKETSFEERTEPEKGVLKNGSSFERSQHQTSSRGILKDSSFEDAREDIEPSPAKTKKHVYGVISGSGSAESGGAGAAESGTSAGESWSTAEESPAGGSGGGGATRTVLRIKNDAVARRRAQQERER